MDSKHPPFDQFGQHTQLLFMDQFQVIADLGNGSFGSVFKAKHTTSGKEVAIKKMKKKFAYMSECKSLLEVKALESLRSSPNIITLHHFFLEKKELHMVFELMEGNLYQLMKDRNGLKLQEHQVRNIIFQVLCGVHHMHSKGIMHRDMKPENLLVSGEVIKIADLGLARDLKSRPPYTTYVSTRWYRAPEVLLSCPNYSFTVDLWAIGTIAAELFSLKPLFPGTSDVDQLNRISGVMGCPFPCHLHGEAEVLSSGGYWKDGVEMAARLGFTFPMNPTRSLQDMIPNASEDAITVIQGLLKYDPKHRSTAYQALWSPWFKDTPGIEELEHMTDVSHSPEKRRSMFSGLRSSKKEGKDQKRELSVSLPIYGSIPIHNNDQYSGNQNEQLFTDLPQISPISPFWNET